MKLLDQYFELQAEIYDYFDYVEDWVAIPLDDRREYYWGLTGEGHGDHVEFARRRSDIGTGNHYEAEIYTQRFLPKWVYRGEEYTMICADTQTDGNKFLMVFHNGMEVDL